MRFFTRKIFLLFCLLLTACGSSGSLTPEMAVLSKLTVAKGVDPFSIRILQTQPYKEHVLILVSYKVINSKELNSEGNQMGCSILYDTYRNKNFWVTGHGGAGCVSIGPFGDWSIGTGSGNTHLDVPGGEPYSYIFGQMDNEEIMAVTLIWEDGFTQTLPVNKGIYLSIRDGQNDCLKVEGKDGGGQTVYTQKFSQP